ncbi:MAG: hypothetical protein IJL26_02840 [Clostridia bacterium]|nr:hypothetical protein [Clostridia bacterium]
MNKASVKKARDRYGSVEASGARYAGTIVNRPVNRFPRRRENRFDNPECTKTQADFDIFGNMPAKIAPFFPEKNRGVPEYLLFIGVTPFSRRRRIPRGG